MTEESQPPEASSTRDFPTGELGEAIALNAPLTPLDEAYIAHADALYTLVCQVIADFPLKPRASEKVGSNLRNALKLRRLADAVVEGAVVVERERGASWTAIGQAADTTQQSAHERWADAVRLWTLSERRHTPIRGSLATARAMDEWYAGLKTATATVPHAITSGLAATNPRSNTEQQASDLERASLRSLYQRLDELRQESEAAYETWFDSLDTDHHTAAQQQWAATHIAAAEVCDELATVEPTITEKHRRAATRQRAIADDILNLKER